MKLILSDFPLGIDINDKNIAYADLSSMKISPCVGCFGCWVKTPGKCVIRDDATKIYPLIAQADEVIYISHVFCGGYDIPMKTMLERAIPIQQAFIRIHNNETHHLQRDVKPKKALIIAYGDISHEERNIFSELIERNALNMNFIKSDVIFTEKNEVLKYVYPEVERWKSLS